jgi:hypothetical protein
MPQLNQEISDSEGSEIFPDGPGDLLVGDIFEFFQDIQQGTGRFQL